MINRKYSKSLKYKNVYNIHVENGRGFTLKEWRASICINGNIITALHETERKAAIFIDLKRIEHRLEPINILKRKPQSDGGEG